MRKLLCERFGGKKGQSMIEYALILAAIILAVVFGARAIKKALEGKAEEAAGKISGASLDFED